MVKSAVKLNYFALDNPCIAHASNFGSRKMSGPDLSDEHAVVRVLRYSRVSGMAEYSLPMAAKHRIFLTYTDSDW